MICYRISLQLLCASLLMSIVVCPDWVWAQATSFRGEPILYQDAEVNDPVAKLAQRLANGQASLQYEEQHGYLKSILRELKVPISSQTLVFSKTSMQVRKISPQRPRAVYFNDDVYVGWCQQGDVLELGATDPQQGAIFYSLKQQPNDRPEFQRDRGQCIVCHASSRTQDVPGYLVRSVFPNRAGHPEYARGTFLTDQTSPFEQRWGGWYVTGTHGQMRHLGNAMFDRDQEVDRESGANLKTLEDLVSVQPYLSPHSDLVALMVLEHQSQMHNAITRANFETRMAVHQSQTMNKILDRDPDYLSESGQRRIRAAADAVVERLLMCDEFVLTSPVSGTSDFAAEFVQANARRDDAGRSLRELDLKTRLFRYPCSYLIYSESFLGLPHQVRQPIVERVNEILNAPVDQFPDFAHLSAEDRKAIAEILAQTHPDFQ